MKCVLDEYWTHETYQPFRPFETQRDQHTIRKTNIVFNTKSLRKPTTILTNDSFHEQSVNVNNPWIGTDPPGPEEADFAIYQIQWKAINSKETKKTLHPCIETLNSRDLGFF